MVPDFCACLRTQTQALGGAGFLALIIGRMTQTHVSKGRSAGIKYHAKGLWTKRLTRASAAATSTRIKAILPIHFRF